MQLHLKLRQLRQLTGKSQDDAAEALEITQSTYSKIESDKIDLTVKQLYTLADLFETSVSDILGDEQFVFNLSQNQKASGMVINNNKASKHERRLYDDFIASLKNEISHLKEINATFKNIIDKKLN